MPDTNLTKQQVDGGDGAARQPLRARLEALIPVAVVVALLAPFVRRAFSIDDPLFIWMAEHILKHPLDPYGLSVNWGLVREPMSKVMQNPPLDSYFIAGVIRLVGLSEVRLHLAFLLPAAVAAWGIYHIARRFCTRPLEATLAAVLTPAFLVCGSTVMCDMMMVAFWVWAVHFWVKGADENRLWMIVLASVLIALSALTKYFGAVLIPLLLAYHFLAKRRPAYLLSFLIPVLVLIAYNYWTQSLYGRGLVLDAFRQSGLYREEIGAALLPKTMTGLAFAGGCLASVIFLAPLMWSRRALAGWVGTAAAAVVVLGLASGHSLKLDGADRWLLSAHMGLFAAAGVSLFALAAADLTERRDADSALLFLWMAGTLLFVGALNWTVNGRVILPAAPAAGVLMMRLEERRRLHGRPVQGRSLALPLALSALLALAVANADYQFACSSRTAALAIHEKFGGQGTRWFHGHWGFQYYMQRLGAEPYDNDTTVFTLGDAVILPVNNTLVGRPPAGARVMTGDFPGSAWLSTMNKQRGTGFHSDVWGPIPYGFGLTSPETYRVMLVDEWNYPLLKHSAK